MRMAWLPTKDQVYGQEYEIVVQEFQKSGFNNIETVAIEDLEFGKVGEGNLVEIVTVDDEEWKTGRVFKDAKITISYHSPKTDTVELDITSSDKIADIEKKLEKSGFKQIDLMPILLVEEGNTDKKDKLDQFSIGSYSYQTGYFYSTSLPVKLTYFDVSKDNIRFPSTTNGSPTKSDFEKQLQSTGLTNVKWNAIADKDKTKHEKIQKITLDGKELKLNSKQDLVTKKTVPVEISYYDFSSFAELPTTISTKTVGDTKKMFTDAGFTQVSEVANETTDISKNGQFISVEIDGKAFNDINDKVIKKDSKVVIKYWNAEKAIAEKARKDEEARLAAEAQKAAEAQRAAEAQEQAQAQIQQFAEAPAQSVYYPNCKAAKQAGAAPVYRGDPGYGSHLDKDGDGVGCER